MEHSSDQFQKLQIIIDQRQAWPEHDLDFFYRAVTLFAVILGGKETFTRCIGDLVVERTDTGSSLGLAYHGRIKFNAAAPISPWTIIHELAHVWDAKNEWGFSEALENYTGGHTSKKLSALKRFVPAQWDAGRLGPEKRPGFYGRKPGCNAAGYFYGDIPSGSNWNFNRREDFAESLAMYCGWGRDNELSKMAHGRVERYLLPNGARDPLYGIIDNWADYAAFFHPENGDYSKTKRWRFMDELIRKHGNVA